MPKLGVTLVGCGRIGQRHLDVLLAMPEAYEVRAIYDVDPHRLWDPRDWLTDPEVETGSDYLIAKPSPTDLTVIATPSGLHGAMVTHACDYGSDAILCEKPLDVDYFAALAACESAELAHVDLFCCLQNRFNPTLQALKSAVNSGRFGRIRQVDVRVHWTRDEAYYQQDAWRGTWHLDGSVLSNQGAHYVDLIPWLFGAVDNVHAYASTTHHIEVPDSVAMSFRTRHGALGTLSATVCAYGGNREGSITVIGDDGYAKIGGVAVNQVDEWDFARDSADDDVVRDRSYATASVYGFGHSAVYGVLHEALTGGPTHPDLATGREALKSVEIVQAAQKSLADETRCGLPYRT